jgi:hypothetical protein
VKLTDHPAYYNALELITHSNVASAARHIANRIDFDIIIIKPFLAILSFSIIGHTVYSNTPPVNLSNSKQILHIQDTYIELIWRYLLYQYSCQEAVKCFL